MESEKKRGRFGKDSFPLGISQNVRKVMFSDGGNQPHESPVNKGLQSAKMEQVFGHRMGSWLFWSYPENFGIISRLVFWAQAR